MARRSSLVSQHLEGISREALERYQKLIRTYIRRRQGVYALYRRKRLYYVGLAGNLTGRLNAHLRDRHHQSWDRFSVYLTIGDSHLKEMESLLLRIAKPYGNKVKGRFAKSENLLRRFKRDVRNYMQQEIDSLVGRLNPRATQIPRTGANHRRKGLLLRLLGRSRKLKAHFKGKTFRARALRDGTIRFNDKKYSSPSKAASAAAGRGVNGWSFWRYERAPGDWVRIRELRR